MHDFHRKGFILLTCCPFALAAKEQRFTFDGDIHVYELTFDDSRMSSADMREIWWLSPWVDESSMGTFSMIVSRELLSSGEYIIDKRFEAEAR